MEFPTSDDESIRASLRDIRNASSDWNLNGDRSLSEVLEKIHRDVILKANDSLKKYENQLNILDSASISLMNINNRFSELCNTQFVENKVQEDDITAINENTNNFNNHVFQKSNPDIKRNDKDESQIINAVIESLCLLEELCEEINFSSDTESESEDNGSNNIEYSVILRPKDYYIESKLPHIIGTQNWQNKWHIGLREGSSGSETDNENLKKFGQDEEFSSSDESEKGSELDKKKNQLTLPFDKKENTITTSDTVIDDNSNNLDVAIMEKSFDQKNPECGSSSAEQNTSDQKDNIQAPLHTQVKPSDFAAELARKLGGNIPPLLNSTTTEEKNKGTRINKNESNKLIYDPGLNNNSTNRISGNIFLDEPPPLDKDPNIEEKFEDLFSSDNDDYISSGLFGDASGVSTPFKLSQNSSDSFETLNKKQASKFVGLFDDLPEEKSSTKKLKSEARTILFDNTDSDDDMNIFNDAVSKKISNKLSSPKEKQNQLNNKVINEKALSLFDDSFENSENYLFGSSKSATITSSSNDVPQIPSTSTKKLKNQESSTKLKKNSGLFDFISDSDDELAAPIERVTTGNDTEQKIVKNVEINIFGEKENTDTHTFDESNHLNSDLKSKLLSGDNTDIMKNVSVTKPEYSGRIDEITKKNDEKDNAFKKVENKNISEIDKQENEQQKKTNFTVGINLAGGLFDDLPPPLDDDINEISNVSDNEDCDLFNDIKDSSRQKTNEKIKDKLDPMTNNDYDISNHKVDLFSSEPPDYSSYNESNLFNKSAKKYDICDVSENLISKLSNSTETIFKMNGAKANVTSDLFFDQPEHDNIHEDIPFVIEEKKHNDYSNSLFSDSDEDAIFKNVTIKNMKSNISEESKTDKSLSVSEVPSHSTIATGKTTQLETNKDISKSITQKLIENDNDYEKRIAQKPINDVPEIDNENSRKLQYLEKVSPSISISKLQNNISINVEALLPRSGYKTIKEINKSIESDFQKKGSSSLPVDNSSVDAFGPESGNASNVQKKYSNTKANVSSPTAVPNNNPDSKNANIISETITNSSTLSNDLLKDRIKIQVKRRPSTRKARHDAVRKSAADVFNFPDSEQLNKTEFTHSLPNSPEKKLHNRDNIDSIMKKNIVIDSSRNANPKYDDSLTNIKEQVKFSDKIDTKNNEKCTKPNNRDISKNVSINFSDEDDLFKFNQKADIVNSVGKFDNKLDDKINKQVKRDNKKLEGSKTIQKNIFSDSDSDSDLFANESKLSFMRKPLEKKDVRVNTKTNADSRSLKSIFGDDDDIDDLFSVSNKSIQPKTIGSQIKDPISKKSLFGDIDSDDDLDIICKNKDYKQQTSSKKKQNVNKASQLKKQNIESNVNVPFKDPLSSFLDD